MNILPKKSWHVLSKPNIERVRRDEAEARAIEEEKAQRAALAEQEARLAQLRSRAKRRWDDGEEEEEEEEEGLKEGEGVASKSEQGGAVTGESDGHINFFADVKQGVGLQLTNAEHEAEKKADQEKLEKRIGLLNYLVDSSKSDQEPWYAKKRQREKEEKEDMKTKRRKEAMDPLSKMQHFVSAKKKSLEATDRPPPLLVTTSSRVSSHTLFPSSSSSHHERRDDHKTQEKKEKPHKHKDKRKHKHKHKERRRERESEGETELEKLRRERRRREEAERAKSEALMRRHYGGETAASAAVSGPQAVEEQPGRYNSQFNPHLARH